MKSQKVGWGRQIAHTGSLILGHMIAYFPQLWFDIRLKYYVWKYNGGQNIPGPIIGKLMGGPNAMKETAKTMNITSAIQDIGNMLKTDFIDGSTYSFPRAVGLYMHGELQDPDMYERIMRMRELPREQVRRAVYNEMTRLGDITERKVIYVFGHDSRSDFEDWLDHK